MYLEDFVINSPTKLSNMKFYDSTEDYDDMYYDYDYDDSATDSFTMAKSFYFSTKATLFITAKYKKIKGFRHFPYNYSSICDYADHKPKLGRMYLHRINYDGLSSYFEINCKRYNRRDIITVSNKRRIYRYLNHLRSM